MFVSLVFLTVLGGSLAAEHWYATYSASEINEAQYQQFVANGTTTYCVLQVEDCVENEGRRLDNTCNSLSHPSMGGQHTKPRRLLSYNYDKGFTPRKALSGKDLPLNRRVRTSLIPEGRVPSTKFTHLLTNFWVFMALDNTLSQDTLNYVINKPFCCTPNHAKDVLCASNPIPDDDPIHRFSEVRCMNMTMPTSYQNQGCINKDTGYDRLNSATPSIDLSFMYGGFLNRSLMFKLNNSGLLRFDQDENGRIWPPAIKNSPHNTCRLNIEPDEVRCNDTPVPVSNTLLGANLFTIWMWRNHNKRASELANLNPHWDDAKLFATARDINIATATQIFYYELYATMYGRERLINDNVLSANSGFRDLYNKTLPPQMTHEYLYSLRWVHTLQENILKQYDSKGNYLKQIPYGNLTFRTGYFTVDHNIESLTQGSFRQPCAHHDHLVDPDVAEISLGPLQRSLDLLVNDNAKGRWLGLQPYIQYRKWCTGKTYSQWSDLLDVIAPERINMLQNVYEQVGDIDLLAGIWLENTMEGAYVPPTLYCLTSQQLRYNVLSDRHWYERPNRPNAFTAKQLAEIRKASISGLLCEVGDGVTHIQPHGFVQIGTGNELTSCSEIPHIDIGAWDEDPKDNTG